MGAEMNVVPPSTTDLKNKQDCSTLRAANGSSIATWHLDLGLLDLGL